MGGCLIPCPRKKSDAHPHLPHPHQRTFVLVFVLVFVFEALRVFETIAAGVLVGEGEGASEAEREAVGGGVFDCVSDGVGAGEREEVAGGEGITESVAGGVAVRVWVDVGERVGAADEEPVLEELEEEELEPVSVAVDETEPEDVCVALLLGVPVEVALEEPVELLEVVAVEVLVILRLWVTAAALRELVGVGDEVTDTEAGAALVALGIALGVPKEDGAALGVPEEDGVALGGPAAAKKPRLSILHVPALP